ncbi:unnamed protein product [Blepharisma stoltei]|uniref:Cytochrome b5 heme-binding domain-containing protein n=1 Tax=Blepharisma stoltei TaxID=1481888 RepID=A0AAU9IYF4_9CILI|nr:unnamed protein product [Blepharisma stoltei]
MQKFIVILSTIISPILSFIYQSLDDYMTLGWEINGNYITFNFLCTGSWCGLGLANTMFGCDMYIAIGGGNVTVPITILDMWSENHDTPKYDTDFWTGEYNIINSTGYFYPNVILKDTGKTVNFINATFTRLLDTGDIWDTVIIPGRSININWAYRTKNSGKFDEHNGYSQGKINFAKNIEDETFTSLSSEKTGLSLHALAMTAFWLIVAPISIMVARYCKHLRCWYFCHLIGFSIVILGTIISASLTYKIHTVSYIQTTSKPRYHSRLGLILTCLVMGQGILGLLCKILQIKFSVYGMIAHARRAHKAVGYGMLIVGLINCAFGFDIYSSSGVYFAGLAIMLVIMLIFELRHQLAFWKPSFLCLKTLPDMTHQEAMEKINNEGLKIMFYEDLVMNVGKFITSHPGGAFMLRDTIGEDAGKYMIGCSNINGDLMPYSHSLPAFDYTRKLAIGKIPYPEGYLQIIDEEESQDCMFWNVSFQEKLSEKIKLISLYSQHFRLSQRAHNPAWLGKHFKITATINCIVISRYYSAFFANLHSWAQELDNSGKLAKKYPACNEGNLQFIYKTYENGQMSQFLDKIEDTEALEIKGPVGPGLLLNSFSGNFVGFAGGTGLVPFLDVAYHLWLNRKNPPAMKFTLFASFRNFDDSFCMDLLDATSNALGENRFKLIQVIDRKAKEMNLTELVKKYAGTKPDAAWVCGPSGYNNFIKNLLIEGGLERNKIIVM